MHMWPSSTPHGVAERYGSRVHAPPRMAFLQEGQANLREPWVCIRDGSLVRSPWLRLRLMLRRRLSVSAVAAADIQLRLSAYSVAAASAAAAAPEASSA